MIKKSAIGINISATDLADLKRPPRPIWPPSFWPSPMLVLAFGLTSSKPIVLYYFIFHMSAMSQTQISIELIIEDKANWATWLTNFFQPDGSHTVSVHCSTCRNSCTKYDVNISQSLVITTGVYSILWILAVLYRAGVNASIVML